jgi:hypothetical protein
MTGLLPPTSFQPLWLTVSSPSKGSALFPERKNAGELFDAFADSVYLFREGCGSAAPADPRKPGKYHARSPFAQI